MKLNYNCLRELMLVLEEHIVWDNELNIKKLYLDKIVSLMPNHSKADIAYATKMAIEAELIEANLIYADDGICEGIYSGLTYEGHQFLDTVRDEKTWNKVKSTAKDIGVSSLKVMKEIAVKLAISLISTIIV